MRNSRLWSLLVAVFFVVSMVAFAPPFARTASAVAAVTSIDPVVGAVGTQVRVIGIVEASANFEIWWRDITTPGGTRLATGRAPASGAVNRLVTLSAAPGGPHDIFLVDLSDATNDSASFDVLPKIVLSPTTGAANRLVNIAGTGFETADDGSIVVDFDGTLVATTPVQASLNVNDLGSWSATFRVPDPVTEGDHVVTAASTSVPGGVTAGFTSPTITLTPATGAVGTVVRVDGVGFQANETGIRVTYGGANIATNPATITADAAGEWTATFVVPTAAVGAVKAVDAVGSITTAAQTAGKDFTIEAGISINPVSGPVGTSLIVTGTGFAASEGSIALTFDGVLKTPLFSASAAGAWTRTFAVPAQPAGDYVVDATGLSSSFFQTFTVTPKISLSPANGPAGLTLTVNGTGFQNAEGITLEFDGATVTTTTPAVIVASDVGSWSATFIVPSGTPGGNHTVDASGDITLADDVPDQTFRVIGLSVNPMTGPVGTSITVNAVGFAANETGVQVLFDGTAIKTGITATAEGTWSTTAIIPAASGGSHDIDASGASTTADTVPAEVFTVTPEIRMSGAGTRPGETVTITGTGFGGAETGIVVLWDGGVQATAGTANSNGGWSTTLTIPNSANGAHAIDARGDTTTASAVADLSLSVQHSFSITPASGTVGTVITVNGSGFFASESGIQVLLDGEAVKSGITAGANGSWSTTLTLGATARGAHTVSAQGATTTTSQVPAKTFTVTPRFSLDPVSGFSGKVVQFSGDGFAASAPIKITFDGAQVTTSPATITSSATGNAGGSFTVPGGAAGSHTVAASDGTGSVSASFSITSSVNLTTSSSAVGGQAGISGQGFPPQTPVTFTFDGSPVATSPATVTTDATGAFTATVIVPGASRGAHPVKITAGAATLTVNVEVTPSLSVTPGSGAPGATITVAGKGFGDGEPITLALDSATLTTSPATVTASKTGEFSATFALPAVAGGVHVVKGTDRAQSAQANLTVTPKAAAATNTPAKTGDKVSVSGSGFPANATVNVTVDGAPATPSSVTSTAAGTVAADVTAPPGAFGVHTISLTSGTTKVDITYSVTFAYTISPGEGNVGTRVTLSGSGFAANSAVTVTYDGAAIQPAAAAATDARGAFTTTVEIPKSAKGQHILAVSDAASHTAQAGFTMESAAPQPPQPLSPANATRQGNFRAISPSFSWTPVTDPSGVMYTFQLAKDPSFAVPMLQKSGLTATSYAATKTEKLGRGMYYWRVKAVDNASNESAYSNVFTLKVGILPVWMPTWMFAFMILIGVAVVAALAYLLLFARKGNRIG